MFQIAVDVLDLHGGVVHEDCRTARGEGPPSVMMLMVSPSRLSVMMEVRIE